MDIGSFTMLKIERQSRVLKVYLNNPSTLNAIDHVLHGDLVRFFTDVAVDPDTDMVILSGAGRAFSAGGDFEYIQRMIEQPALFNDSLVEAKRLIYLALHPGQSIARNRERSPCERNGPDGSPHRVQ